MDPKAFLEQYASHNIKNVRMARPCMALEEYAKAIFQKEDASISKKIDSISYSGAQFKSWFDKQPASSRNPESFSKEGVSLLTTIKASCMFSSEENKISEKDRKIGLELFEKMHKIADYKIKRADLKILQNYLDNLCRELQNRFPSAFVGLTIDDKRRAEATFSARFGKNSTDSERFSDFSDDQSLLDRELSKWFKMLKDYEAAGRNSNYFVVDPYVSRETAILAEYVCIMKNRITDKKPIKIKEPSLNLSAAKCEDTVLKSENFSSKAPLSTNGHVLVNGSFSPDSTSPLQTANDKMTGQSLTEDRSNVTALMEANRLVVLFKKKITLYEDAGSSGRSELLLRYKAMLSDMDDGLAKEDVKISIAILSLLNHPA